MLAATCGPGECNTSDADAAVLCGLAGTALILIATCVPATRSLIRSRRAMWWTLARGRCDHRALWVLCLVVVSAASGSWLRSSFAATHARPRPELHRQQERLPENTGPAAGSAWRVWPWRTVDRLATAALGLLAVSEGLCAVGLSLLFVRVVGSCPADCVTGPVAQGIVVTWIGIATVIAAMIAGFVCSLKNDHVAFVRPILASRRSSVCCCSVHRSRTPR